MPDDTDLTAQDAPQADEAWPPCGIVEDAGVGRQVRRREHKGRRDAGFHKPIAHNARHSVKKTGRQRRHAPVDIGARRERGGAIPGSLSGSKPLGPGRAMMGSSPTKQPS